MKAVPRGFNITSEGITTDTQYTERLEIAAEVVPIIYMACYLSEEDMQLAQYWIFSSM